MFLEQALAEVIRPGDTVLDVGGHVGAVAAHMASRAARVYSFEPHPEKFAALQQRATALPNLHAFNCAVSDSAAPVTLYYGMTAASDEASTICTELATPRRLGEDMRAIEVPATTLDQFCAAHRLRPDLIKIDVEGAEPLVLKGARAVLDTAPLLVVELSTEGDLPAYVNDLRRRGYALYLTELTHFKTRPPTWEHVTTSHTSAFDRCLISFTNDELLMLVPFHANALAALPGKHDDRLAGFRKLPLTEAAQYLGAA